MASHNHEHLRFSRRQIEESRAVVKGHGTRDAAALPPLRRHQASPTQLDVGGGCFFFLGRRVVVEGLKWRSSPSMMGRFNARVDIIDIFLVRNGTVGCF
uniref:Uncharacterized protein n=1 Tax=Triticum urartu TaxID=4572 RepID=A0A8R7TF65_TRIUA